MRKLAVFLVLMLPLFTFGMEKPKTTNNSYRGEGFALLLPQDVTVVKRTPVDFDLYTFTQKGNVILRMYVGNQPDTESEGFLEKGRDKKDRESGYTIRSITRKTIGGLVSREVLFDLSFRKKGWPCYFHLWYARVSAPAAKTADEIIASVEPSVEDADSRSQGKKEKK